PKTPIRKLRLNRFISGLSAELEGYQNTLWHQFFQRFAEDTSVLIAVRRIGLRRHQRHIVKRSEQYAAVHCVEMHEPLEFEIHGIVSLAAISRWLGRKLIFGTASQARDV